MKTDRLKRLLSEGECALLKSYEQHELDMDDLQIMTNFKKNEIRYVINTHFPNTPERRIENKLKMEGEIENYINIGIPVDIFREEIMLIKNLYQNQSLLRYIQRLIDNYEIEVELPQITLYKFNSILNRVIIKRSLVENMKKTEPLTIKELAKDLHVSESSVFKINRKLNVIDPINTVLDDRIGERVEELYDIHLALKNGATMTSIKSLYNYSMSDIRMIKKTFQHINQKRKE